MFVLDVACRAAGARRLTDGHAVAAGAEDAATAHQVGHSERADAAGLALAETTRDGPVSGHVGCERGAVEAGKGDGRREELEHMLAHLTRMQRDGQQTQAEEEHEPGTDHRLEQIPCRPARRPDHTFHKPT